MVAGVICLLSQRLFMALFATGSGPITLNYRIILKKGGSKGKVGALEHSPMVLSSKMEI